MHVAIVHDWLNGMRGGEKVLEELLDLFPEAVIYTLFHERGKVSRRIESHRIETSWLNRIPGVYRYYRNLLPLFPSAIESLDLSGFDLVISSSHAAAKGVRAPGATHICYCHTPMRYVWDAEDDYAFGPLQRIAMRAVRSRLRRWDCEAATRVDHFMANSRFVAERIRTYYGRDAAVIYPPVDTDFFTPPTVSNTREDFYLFAGALAPYKRVDLAVEACAKMGRRLVVTGNRGWVSNEELRQLYRTAKGLIVAGREDFGIVTVEAIACGCPVIAFAAGGSAEIVKDGVNGILFAEQQAHDIVRALRRFETMSWPEDQVRQQVETFSREAFRTGIRKFITERAVIESQAQISELQPA